jgi:DnaA-homolog protein
VERHLKQLLLDIRPDAPPTLANFVTGANQPLLDALAVAVAVAGPGDHVYLWGEAGCGKSHLLRAACAAAELAGRPSHYCRSDEEGEFPATADALLAVDDVEELPEARQIALFNAFNRARPARQTLILGGPAAPLGLPLREDLRTRIGQTLVFHVRPLDDLARSAILRTQAERRGLRLEEDVIAYLLRFNRRDLPSLLAVLEALDEASLERKRPITLPLLRQIMQAGLDI